jgi:hypothetical protein
MHHCSLKLFIYRYNSERKRVILGRNTTPFRMKHYPVRKKLLLVEPVLPSKVESVVAMSMVMSDLNMLLNAGSRERSEAEFRTLFTSAGVKLTSAVTPALVSTSLRIIEGAHRDLP